VALNVKNLALTALQKPPLTVENISSIIQRCPICGKTPAIETSLVSVHNFNVPLPAFSIKCCGKRIEAVSRSFTIKTWNLHVLRKRKRK